MKPLPSFTLHRPESLREALRLMRDLKEAKAVAGGTDLLLFMRDGTVRAENLVDLSSLEELRHIKEEGGEILIGATTTINEAARSSLIAEKAPALRDAAACLGSPQIRNLGTLGGNLCNASPAADTAPPLIALDTKARIASLDGARSIPLLDLFAGPKLNSLKPHEILTEISFPTPPKNSGMSFQKLGRRRGYNLAVVNAAAYIEADGESCRKARLALGAVSSTPIRVKEAEAMLQDQRLSHESIREAAAACQGLVRPVDDVRGSAEYRRAMSCVLMRRALTGAWEMARRHMR
jgi:carbon-monoxide dehydrogenase medium subunit